MFDIFIRFADLVYNKQFTMERISLIVSELFQAGKKSK